MISRHDLGHAIFTLGRYIKRSMVGSKLLGMTNLPIKHERCVHFRRSLTMLQSWRIITTVDTINSTIDFDSHSNKVWSTEMTYNSIQANVSCHATCARIPVSQLAHCIIN